MKFLKYGLVIVVLGFFTQSFEKAPETQIQETHAYITHCWGYDSNGVYYVVYTTTDPNTPWYSSKGGNKPRVLKNQNGTHEINSLDLDKECSRLRDSSVNY